LPREIEPLNAYLERKYAADAGAEAEGTTDAAEEDAP
jgi:hypothetical protein